MREEHAAGIASSVYNAERNHRAKISTDTSGVPVSGSARSVAAGSPNELNGKLAGENSLMEFFWYIFMMLLVITVALVFLLPSQDTEKEPQQVVSQHQVSTEIDTII